jgi:hypothetical protein
VKASKLINLTFFILIFPLVYSQQKTEVEEIDLLIEELFFSQQDLGELINENKISLIYSSVNYNSNTYYSGRSIGVNQFNLSPQISYLNSNGLTISLSGIYLDQFEPAWDLTTISIGYSKWINKRNTLSLNTNFSNYFYSYDQNDIYSRSVSLGMSYQSFNDKLFLNTSAGIFFDGSNLFQIASNFYYSFNLIKKREKIKEQNKRSQVWKVNVNGKQKPRRILTDKLTLDFKPMVSFYFNSETIDTEYSPSFFINQKSSADQNYFGLINTQIKLPIEFNLNNIDLEFSYYINIPVPIGDENNLPNTSFFGISIGYLFDL